MRPPKLIRSIVYLFFVVRHRLTCHWCYGDWFTFLQRKQTGRGASDAAIIAAGVIVALWIIGSFIGQVIKNGA